MFKNEQTWDVILSVCGYFPNNYIRSRKDMVLLRVSPSYMRNSSRIEGDEEI